MLICGQGHIKLADFGLSAEGEGIPNFADDPKLIASGDAPMYKSAVGTTDYLAPEILRQEGYSHMVDFWALGACVRKDVVSGCRVWCGRMRGKHGGATRECRFGVERRVELVCVAASTGCLYPLLVATLRSDRRLSVSILVGRDAIRR